jgi:hypothetical protein
MLTCLCVVHHNEGRLPEGRSRLYRAVIEWLLRAKSELRTQKGYRDEFARYAFEALAWHMMAGPKGKRSTIDLADALVAIEPELKREYAEKDQTGRERIGRAWLEFECVGSGIVSILPGSQVRFWHLTFQEYLAALAASRRHDWWDAISPHLDDLQWRETVELLPGCLFDVPGRERVDELLRRVVAMAPEGAALGDEARAAAILARLLAPLGACGYKVPANVEAAHKGRLERCLEIFTVAGARAVPVHTRIEVAEALGKAGDPRLQPECDNFLPVPGSPGVFLAKYPVTVEEYQRFVEAEGYTTRACWSEEGWAAKGKEEWAEPGAWETQVEMPNRPVTGVSWHEAEAYCRWLSEHRGREIRVPTEAEWEAAATSPDGKYPWGGPVLNPELANFARNTEGTTSVGIYPAGNSPGGHCDIAGNVWEWCAEREDRLWFANKESRPVRGGSWDYPAEYLPSLARIRLPFLDRLYNLGFRLAAGPVSRA